MNQPSRLILPYMLLVCGAGYGLLAWLLAELVASRHPVPWAQVAFFVALAIAVGLQPVRLPRGGAMVTVGFAVDYASLLIFGPALASCIGVLSFLVALRRSSWLRQLFNHGQLVISFTVAGWLYQSLGGSYVAWSGHVQYGSLRSGLALFSAAAGYLLTSTLLVAVAVALWERRSILGMWAMNYLWGAPHLLALAPFGLLMAIVYQLQGLGPAAIILFLVPLAGARYAFQGAMEMLQVHRETVHALSAALEAYDPYTRNHSELVTRYALALGNELSLSARQLETLEWAGRLHDIGKCRHDWDSIIRKVGRPTEAEWEIIKRHPVEGAKLAEKMEFLPHTAGEVARVVRAHHERYDGSGYPEGLAGEAIPFEARVLGLADAFEAMTAKRAYQRSRSLEQAVAEVERCAGQQFDPRVAAALVALHARGALAVSVETQPAEEARQASLVPGQA